MTLGQEAGQARSGVGLRLNRGTLLGALLIIPFALIPLYGIVFPPLADLSHQLLVNKLFWEKLTGASHLDLEIPAYLGYRMVSFFIVVPMSVCRFLGISFVYIPIIVSVLLTALHAFVIGSTTGIAAAGDEQKPHWSSALLALPAVVAMYSACWFMGFIGFTLGVTLLVPAIFLTERYIRKGRLLGALPVAIAIFLIYTAHPFAVGFWLLWCFARALASLATWAITAEIKRLLALGLIFTPLLAYHLLATTGSELQMSGQSLTTESPFLSTSEWYQTRVVTLLGGKYLKADESGESAFFAWFAACFFSASVIVALISRRRELKQIALTALVFAIAASWINERFIPLPKGHWLAYDYRFASAIYAVCLSISAVVFARFFSASPTVGRKIALAVLAVVSMTASLQHLITVRAAYVRFDVPAREYMAAVFERRQPNASAIPRSPWYLDNTFLRRYVCLGRPDCNPAGTLFRNLGGEIYPVKLKSGLRVGDEGPVDPSVPRISAFLGGEGYGAGQFSRPLGIAADKAGNFYVADTGNGRIQKFDTDGNFLMAFGGPGEGQGGLREVAAVAVDDEGRVYTVNVSEGKLVRFRSDGSLDASWPGPNSIPFAGRGDMAFASDGRLFILDQGRTRVVVFDPRNEAFMSWGSMGSGPGQFIRPTGITAAGEAIIVADLGNDRIQVFDLAGTLQRQWDVPTWGRYTWHYPDVVYDGEVTKRLYATNGWKKEVLVFDLDGRSYQTLVPNSPAGSDNLSSMALTGQRGGPQRLLMLNTASEAFDLGEPSVVFFDLTSEMAAAP